MVYLLNISGFSKITDSGRKKILLLKGKEKEIADVSIYLLLIVQFCISVCDLVGVYFASFSILLKWVASLYWLLSRFLVIFPR